MSRKLPLILDVTMLNQVVSALTKCKFPEDKWFELGLALGLLPNTLSAIEADYRRVSRCLFECLTKWLKKADKTISFGPLTWHTLCNALKNIQQTHVAQEIKETMDDPACQLLQWYCNSGKFSNVVFTDEVIQILQKDKVITGEMATEIEINEYYLVGDSMNTLYTVVANDHDKMRLLAQTLVLLDYDTNKHLKCLGEELLFDYVRYIPDTVPMSLCFGFDYDLTSKPTDKEIIQILLHAENCSLEKKIITCKKEEKLQLDTLREKFEMKWAEISEELKRDLKTNQTKEHDKEGEKFTSDSLVEKKKVEIEKIACFNKWKRYITDKTVEVITNVVDIKLEAILRMEGNKFDIGESMDRTRMDLYLKAQEILKNIDETQLNAIISNPSVFLCLEAATAICIPESDQCILNVISAPQKIAENNPVVPRNISLLRKELNLKKQTADRICDDIVAYTSQKVKIIEESQMTILDAISQSDKRTTTLFNQVLSNGTMTPELYVLIAKEGFAIIESHILKSHKIFDSLCDYFLPSFNCF